MSSKAPELLPLGSFAQAVHHAVRGIPGGRVMSYGDIAVLLGRPRSARGVGWALAALPDDTDVPWWRVVNRNGEITSPSVHHLASRQRALLEVEGVAFDPVGRIDREEFGWFPSGREEGGS